MKKSSLFLIAFLILVSPCVAAQECEDTLAVRTALCSMFSQLDKSRVPTGYLRDYAVEFAELDLYDGASLNDYNYATSKEFAEILRTMRQAYVGSGAGIPAVSGILQDMSAIRPRSVIPLGVVAYKYNYIREDALTDSLIDYSNGMVYDAFGPGGVWKNPYLEKKVFAFSPITNVSTSLNVTYIFQSTNALHTTQSYIFSNLSQYVLEFDDGSGAGYVSVLPNTPITVSYSTYGVKELKLRLSNFNDNYQLVAHSKIAIVERSNPNRAGLSSSIAIPTVTTDTLRCTNADVGEVSSCFLETSKAIINSSDSIKRPFIIVEGFDVLFDKENNPYGNNRLVKSSIDSTFFVDYDIIYVNWLNHGNHIQSNAYLLKEVLEYINSIKAHDAEKTVLYAESMGGLIASYALKTMENAGILHDVSVFVSDDVPYLGANVPIGALFAVNDILYNCKLGAIALEDIARVALGVLKKESILEYIELGKTILNYPSVKQMLMNYISPAGIVNNSYHNSFMQVFYDLGFPSGDPGEKMKLLAITNGGTNDYVGASFAEAHGIASTSGYSLVEILSWFLPKELFVTGLLFGLQGPFFWKTTALPGPSQMDLDLSILPFSSSGCKVYDFKMKYTKRFLWIANIDWTLYQKEKQAPSGFGVDISKGSFYTIQVQDSLKHLFHLQIDTTVWGFSINYSHDVADTIMFVPSASALCIGRGLRQLTSQDYTASYLSGVPASETPFDDFFIESTATYHTSLNPAKNRWLYDNISYDIVCSPCPVSGDSLSVRGWNAPVTWSTSDSSIATIGSNGILSVHGSGFVTLNAQSTSGTSSINLNKRVMVGFPGFYLTYDIPTGIITATPTSVEFWDFVNPTNVLYYWAIWKQGNNNLLWKLRNTNTFYEAFEFMTPKKAYFFASNTHYTSPTYVKNLGALDLMSPITINGDGVLFVDDATDIHPQTRGLEGGHVIVCSLLGRSITFDHYPSSREFVETLLNDSAFSELWQRIKPWGEEEELSIEMTVEDRTEQLTVTGSLVLLYEEDFGHKQVKREE